MIALEVCPHCEQNTGWDVDGDVITCRNCKTRWAECENCDGNGGYSEAGDCWEHCDTCDGLGLIEVDTPVVEVVPPLLCDTGTEAAR